MNCVFVSVRVCLCQNKCGCVHVFYVFVSKCAVCVCVCVHRGENSAFRKESSTVSENWTMGMMPSTAAAMLGPGVISKQHVAVSLLHYFTLFRIKTCSK